MEAGVRAQMNVAIYTGDTNGTDVFALNRLHQFCTWLLERIPTFVSTFDLVTGILVEMEERPLPAHVLRLSLTSCLAHQSSFLPVCPFAPLVSHFSSLFVK